MMSSKGQKLDLLAVLLLLLVFCTVILALLFVGAKSYRAITALGSQTQDQRVAELYIGNKIRQADRPDLVRVARYGQTDCLEIPLEANGKAYVTRVYCYEGWVRELLAAQDTAFAPEDGEKVTEAQDLSFEEADGMVRAHLTTERGQSAMVFCAGGESHDE